MKLFHRLFVVVGLFVSLIFTSADAHAFRADHFKGIYEVLAEHADPLNRADKKYVLCDVDTVANIWAKYGEGELPADLTPIKDEPSILVGFTFRKGLFFNLERNALVGDTTLAMPGPKTDTMRLSRKADGNYELGVRLDNVVTFFDLGPKEPLRGQRNRLPHPLQID